MLISALIPIIFILLVVGVLTKTMRSERRPAQTLNQRANHPLRKFQIALNEPRKQAQRAVRDEALRAAREQEPKPGSVPERMVRPEVRRLKQV
ncbi:MAG: hypothetical protein ACRDZ3_11455 [Acidimicrobiia bacterium]